MRRSLGHPGPGGAANLYLMTVEDRGRSTTYRRLSNGDAVGAIVTAAAENGLLTRAEWGALQAKVLKMR